MRVSEPGRNPSPLGVISGREMGELVRSFDWSATPLGPQELWSPALRTTARTLLASRFPQLLWWGPEYISIYNDAYRPILGRKHPWALGRPVRECWSEIWEVLRPLIDAPFQGGPATWSEDIELQINRAGFIEETHFTIAYSPVPDDAAASGIGGVLATVHEITEEVVGRRRVTVLHALGMRPAEAKSAEEACILSAATLKAHAKDLPFVLFYLIDASGQEARLAASCGVGSYLEMAPPVLALDQESSGQAAWPVASVLRSGQMEFVENLASRFASVPPGPWPDPPAFAVVAPIRSHLAHHLAGFLITGLSARLQFSDGYRDFLDLVSTQVATAIASARSYELERNRAETLAEIDRAKTTFFSNISHEFRTPLTLMLGPLEEALANHHGILPMDAAASLAVSHRNALRLLKLVNNLLDFSRIEAGRSQARYQPVDLAALTTALASNFQSLCDSAGLRLIIHCPPLPPGEAVYVDREMWEKIVLNLLSNAFKFTLHGEIEVRLAETDRQAVLTVRDTGVGIPSEELPRMFERFHRIERNRGRTYEGSGIGLALVQELVKLHGGTAGVESVLGQGTEFQVRIPRGKEHLAPESVGEASVDASRDAIREAFVEEALSWVPDAGTAAPVRDSDLPTAEGGRKARILWVDDNADLRGYVARLLRPGFEVEALADGKAALAAARANKPDLVLSDVMMPGLDGVGLLRELRADPQLREIPVILLSARAGEEARIEGLEARADDYLIKPFSTRELLARIESQLKLSGLRRDAAAAIQKTHRDASLLAAIVESSDDAIISKDLDGTIMSWNQAAERLFGYTAAEAVGQSITILIPGDRPNEEPEILSRLKRGERVDHFETVRIRKDGRRLNISLTISPVKDPTGRIVGASKVARDITARVRQEQALKEANAALQRANGDLQQFAYSASHDLQEPLRTVRIYSELLQQRFAEQLGAEGKEFIRHAVAAAGRMEDLLRNLRTYTQVSAGDREIEAESDSGEALQKTLEELKPAIEESGASIVAGSLPRVPLPAFQMEQLFLNLIGNAIRYRNGAPRIQVDAVPRNGGWLFSVQDNGIGIEPRFRDQIFGIFKRLHSSAEYPGTGMGLAICQRIVQRTGGRIWVESEPGEGSTFYFTIPKDSTPIDSALTDAF